MEGSKKTIITLNGYVGLIRTQIAHVLLDRYFKHFRYISQDIHISRQLNGERTVRILKEYNENGNDLLIESELGYKFIPESFKVFFVDKKSLSNKEKQKYDLVIDLRKISDIEKIAEGITVEYGYWTLDKDREKELKIPA